MTQEEIFGIAVAYAKLGGVDQLEAILKKISSPPKKYVGERVEGEEGEEGGQAEGRGRRGRGRGRGRRRGGEDCGSAGD
jgi:hypothetical protein